MRVVSLLPAGTEMVAALGLLEQLVGVSHECGECTGLPEVQALPGVTRSAVHGAGLSSAEVDRQVTELMRTGQPLYSLDEPLLRELKPDVILTQRLCDVCAVGWGTVHAFASTLPGPPLVVNLEPLCLEDVFGDIRRVAEALGQPEAGEALLVGLRERVEAVRVRAAQVEVRPRVFLMEWADPPFCAGHWNPQLVALAGGEEVLGRAGEPSRRVEWSEIAAAAPEVVLVACCGFTVERAKQDLALLEERPEWRELPAVRSGRVHVVDGNLYFTCPGPRVVDSLEILAEALHPELFAGCL